MKRNYFSVLFFIKKTKLLKNGEAPIGLRITVNGQRAEIQIKRSIDIRRWNRKKECAIGKEVKSQELNYYIESIRSRILQIHRELEMDNKPITAEIIKGLYYGRNDDVKMLLSVFDVHNRKARELLGKEYVLGTVLRFERTARYIKEFLEQQYNLSDISFKEINQSFILDFEHFLKTDKQCGQNATVKYLKILKRIIRKAIANKWMDIDPYIEVHLWQTKTHRDFLTEDEISLLVNKRFSIQRLEIVKDIFVFCCFTGLAFVDASQLRPEHIVKDNKGEFWIRKARQKTKNMCNVPLLEIPRILIDKYKDHPEANKKGLCLPVPANQKMNSYLKEIADLCGINKSISTHTARHTFASVVMLANDVSIENVAKMLGHSDTRMTQHYAKVLDSSIMRDMQKVRANFNI